MTWPSHRCGHCEDLRLEGLRAPCLRYDDFQVMAYTASQVLPGSRTVRRRSGEPWRTICAMWTALLMFSPLGPRLRDHWRSRNGVIQKVAVFCKACDLEVERRFLDGLSFVVQSLPRVAKDRCVGVVTQLWRPGRFG